MGQNVNIRSGYVREMLGAGKTTTGAGSACYRDAPMMAFHASVVGTGAVTASVNIEVSNDGTNWCSTVMGTITLSGTTRADDGFTSTGAPWKYVRANVTAVSGTGATVQVLMSV